MICGFCLAEMRLGYSLETRGPWKAILKPWERPVRTALS